MKGFIEAYQRKNSSNKILINVNDIIRVEEDGAYATVVVNSHNEQGTEKIELWESYRRIIEKISET